MITTDSTMVIGILESTSDRFMNDVASSLEGIEVDFMSLSGGKIPTERTYRVVVDRLSFRYPFLRELLKSLSLSGTYIINNPFAAQSTNKLVEILVGNRLGLNFPKTILLPDRLSIEETEGLITPPCFDHIAEELGFPCILKPYDGYAWEDVHVVGSKEELIRLYQSLYSRRILIVQQLIKFRDYFRAFCFDKRHVLFIKWIPKPFAMGHYLDSDRNVSVSVISDLTEMTVRLNEALDLDINVVEWCVDEEGRWWIIEAFNEVPDVTAEALPNRYYTWIVETFALCIRCKLDSGKRNRIPFD
jgi:hypothetical protein